MATAQAAASFSEPIKITVAGELNSAKYQKCCVAVRHLSDEHPGIVSGECLPFFQTQWEEYLKRTANTLKGAFY